VLVSTEIMSSAFALNIIKNVIKNKYIFFIIS
jgi:hypothetical protein